MEQSQSADPQSRALPVVDVLAALAACLLLASMFLGWFRHYQSSQLGGIDILFPSTNGNLIIAQSGWDTSSDAGAAALVMAAVALGRLLVRRLGYRDFGAIPGLVVAGGGVLTGGLIAHAIAVPPSVYTQHQPGVYVALTAALVSIPAGLASAIAHGAKLSRFEPRRLEPGGVLAALAGLLLLLTMSLGWYGGRKYFSGSMPGYNPPDSLSPWASGDWIAYPLAAVAVAAIVLCLARGFRAPKYSGLESIAVALGGFIAAILVLKRIDDPHAQAAVRNLYMFDQARTEIYLSLGACIAIFAGAGMAAWRSRAALAAEWAALRRELGLTRSSPTPTLPQAGDRRLPSPLVAGSAIALLIAILALWLSPVIAAAVIAGFAIGFAVRHWTLLLAPWLIAIPGATIWYQNHPCTGDEGDCLNALVFVVAIAAAAYVCVAIAIGIVARRLSDRAGSTSLRRRSS